MKKIEKRTTPSGGSETRRRTFSVIFKGLDRCNSRCTFCSVGDTEGRIIKDADLEVVMEQLKGLVEKWGLETIQFTFHGGEPTLLGADLIDTICQAACSLAPSVKFNMQSNLVSLTDSLMEVFEKHTIRLGTSVDPLGVDRVDRTGNSMFRTWLDSYIRLAERKRPPGAIYVVTRSSLGKERQIYDICEAIGDLTGHRFSLQVNHIYAQGRAGMPGNGMTISGEEFGEFMVRLWKTWEMKGRSLSLSPIQSFADYFRNSCKHMPESLLCAFSKNCAGSHVGIDYDLNVAACGRRLDSRAFLGNLRNDSLIHILENDEEMEFFSKRTDILHRKEPCSLCNYFMLCHGGCPDDAFLGSGRMDEPYPLCAGYRKLFEAMKTTARSISKQRIPDPGTFHGKEKKKEVLCTLSLTQLADPPFSWDRLWMLPDPEGAWLQFDSGLKDRVGKGRRRQLVQLWCYNWQVKSLMMWEDLLRTRDTWVCLFEPEGLEPAMNILNSLGATVFLDVVSIRRKGGRELLERAVNRLTSDPVWQIQVYPFSDLILRVINHRSSGFVDRFDLAPGRFRITVLGEVDGVSGEIVESASQTGGASPSEWASRRAGCLPCKHFGICGGRFSSDSVDGCPQDVRSIVDTIVSVAEKMKTVLPCVSMEK